MAMLAEPRRKHKYSINPRGTHWSNDDSKFGQKLMEKYGWSKGKGLGANEDGRIENVGIKLKSDNKGVGCTKKFADKWIEHQDDFNDLLQSLNQDQNNADDSQNHKVVSLEKKSETSRKRVHYMKFTKGKDLSSRSKHDLECIFGTRKHKKKTKVEEEIVEEEVVKEEVKVTTNETHDTDHGVTTFTNTCSIQEYFALKMKQRKEAMMGTSDNNNQSASSNGIAAELSDSSNQSDPSNDTDADQSETVLEKKKISNFESKKRKRVSFNLDYDLFEFDKDSDIISENISVNSPKISKKKKKLKSEDAASDEDENFVTIKKKKKKSKVTEVEECEKTTEIHKNLKKKKKSKKSAQEEDESETEIAESPKRKKAKNKMEDQVSSPHKKRKTSKLPEYHNVCLSDENIDSVGKEKKKKKLKNGDCSLIDESDNDFEELTPKKKKKSKKSKIDKSKEIAETPSSVDEDSDAEEMTPKMKKKTKNSAMDASLDDTTPKIKKKGTEGSLEGSSSKSKNRPRKLSASFEDDSVLDPDVEILKEKTKKKKKSKKNKREDSILDDDKAISAETPEKKSKKKKKRSKSNNENTSDLEMDENDISEITVTNGHVDISDSEKPKPKVVRTEYHAIDRTNSKKGYSLTGPEVESVCKNFKGSNFHEIVGYLNSGLVATEHYS